ncbi:hypothetical protein O181_040583 [Austropuccinia psidii MF-1]|uniref:Uncharacterized protein n=1 Tax=Austropuccinia psidii MF-1 TaxID=1389203 RepID=A0A9Q3DFN1_9BASI|nr:hypothetical protein [Austropuccinia psidii MF-1]
MEDARTSTSSQRLASTFETLIESPEADITAIPVVRPELFPAGNNGDIPVSVQELAYGGKAEGVGTSVKSLLGTMNSYIQVKKFMGPENTEELLRGRTPMSCKGQFQQIKAWMKNQSMLSEDQKKLAQGKDNSPVEAPQASTSRNTPQQVPNKEKRTPKRNQKGKKKAKGKAKSKWNKPYPQNYRIPKKEKTVIENVFNMARNLMESKNKEEERLNQHSPNE